MQLPWLKNFYDLSANDIGIDLGTANTLVYVKGHGVVIAEPSIVAVNQKTGRIVAVGNDAKQMVGRTPSHLEIIHPLIDGVISNFEITQEVLSYFLRRVEKLKPKKFFRPRVIIGTPSGVTNVQVRAVRDAARQAGARHVHVVLEPMAAAIGIGLPIKEPIGNLIVDVGGGTSDIAVISLSGIVRSKNLRVAGDHLNRDIVNYVRDEFKVLLGQKTAEEVKIAIGSVWEEPDNLEATIRGRDLVTGLPKEVVITDADIRAAIATSIHSLIEAIREVLETTPPEVISDVMNKGIVLVGGGAILQGLDNLLTNELKIPVTVAPDPLTAVARGMGIILENLDDYRDILLPEDDELSIT